MIKDKKVFIFFFLMNLILLDFGNQIRKVSYLNLFNDYSNPIFSIMHTNNTGGAFSILQNSAYFLSALGFIAFIFISFFVIKTLDYKKDKISLFSLTLFSAGTIGNAIERFSQGYIVDYIKLNFINFPIFNAFDIMITVGCALYVIFVILNKDNKEIKDENNN